MENWYEKNYLDVVMLHKDTYVYRKQSAGLGPIEYVVSIDGVQSLIPKSFYLSLLEQNEGCVKFIEYKFLDENFKTYSIYERRTEDEVKENE